MKKKSVNKSQAQVITLQRLESLVTVMSQQQYKRLELNAQRKEQPSSFTAKEILALEKKLNKLREDANKKN